MAIVADDNVVGHMDAEDSPGLDEGFGDLPVCLRWRGVAARMIVHHHDCERRADHGRTEHFPRMRHRFVEATDGNEMMPANPQLHVEQQDGDTFHVRIEVGSGRDVPAPVVHRLLRNLARW